MAKQLMPKATLEPRDSDLLLTDEQLLRIGLFARLKRKPTLEKFPGALILRRYREGEVIFRQGEAGWTAFYILTSEDMVAIGQAPPPETVMPDLTRTLRGDELAALRQRVEQIRGSDRRREDRLRTVAMVYLAVARSPRAPNFRQRRKAEALAGPLKNIDQQTMYIPVDGPVTLRYDSLRADLHEGELFGEMSCLYRTPRSATVVATRDCYMLEMLRNILDQLQKDPAHKVQMDAIYKERVLDLQLRKLSIFADLDQQQYGKIRDKIELVSCEPGQLICDENDRSDNMYIVRSGLVKVMKNVSALLGMSDIRDWGALAAALREGEQQPGTPRSFVWTLLPWKARGMLRGEPPPLSPPSQGGDKGGLSEIAKAELLYALNDIIKTREFWDARDLQEVVKTPAVSEQLKALPEKRKDWSEIDHRNCNRFALEAILGPSVRNLVRQPGPPCVLSYLSRGDFFGEMGLINNEPRSATCITHGQPGDTGQIELACISKPLFREILEGAPRVRDKVEQIITERKRHTVKREQVPIWDEGSQALLSGRFEQLGLIQGQKLMLVDLDRCTRCDECVKACVNTHDDGRTRLFLDGPRFGKYLVPTTCRSCLDPVCMIGCPVGSIHRGNNGQIVIEDWCIGCGLCSDQCPYGAIQMHDIGVIRESARGWRFMPATAVGSKEWNQPSFSDRGWLTGSTPFAFDTDFRAAIAPIAKQADSGAIYFRREFHLQSEQLQPASEFKMEVTSCDPAAAVWINGLELKTDEKPKRGKREYVIPPKPAAGGAEESKQASIRRFLRSGRNVVAVRATPGDTEDALLQLRLDEMRRPDLPEEIAGEVAEEITQKLVTERAVVCDLCSSLRGGPACVSACPHEAALRVNARFEFPAEF